MPNFVGFALIELKKATGTKDSKTKLTYDCVIYDKLGRVTKTNMKLPKIERDWCKLRMKDSNGNRYAILVGTDVYELSQETFLERLAEWEAKAVA